MYTSIRYAIPSAYYEKIDIRSMESDVKGGLKDAAGM